MLFKILPFLLFLSQVKDTSFLGQQMAENLLEDFDSALTSDGGSSPGQHAVLRELCSNDSEDGCIFEDFVSLLRGRRATKSFGEASSYRRNGQCGAQGCQTYRTRKEGRSAQRPGANCPREPGTFLT